MNWFHSPKPRPQADGDDGAKFDSQESRREPYPQLNSVQQDEAIYLLKGRLDALEKSVVNILALLEQNK